MNDDDDKLFVALNEICGWIVVMGVAMFLAMVWL